MLLRLDKHYVHKLQVGMHCRTLVLL